MKSTKMMASLVSTVFIVLSAVTAANAAEIEFGGVVEVEAGYTNPESGESESDIVVATVELGVSAEINEQLSAEVVALYEEDDTDLEIDVALINYAFNDTVSLTAGQLYVPFGAYETGLVSDPLTLEIGETRETVLMAGFEQDAWSAAVYLFNGDNDKGASSVDNFGLNVGYATDTLSFGLSYINDLGDSDGLQGALASSDVGAYTDGVSAFVMASVADFTLIAEYTAAMDEFPVELLEGIEPSATNLEIDYAISIAGKPATVALAYQTSDESVLLELPESRVLLGLSVEMNEHFGIGFEVSRDEDYGLSDGGTDESTTNVVLQLAASF